MKIIPLSNLKNPAKMQEVLLCLKSNGVVVFPSDTVYGLLVDSTNPEAVSRLLAFKDRPPGKAVSVFVSDFEKIETICTIPEKKKGLLQKLLPGAYTVVLDSLHTLDTRLESEKKTLGVRFIDFKPVIDLVTRFGKPLTATSANLGGRSPHYSVQSFLNDLPKKKEQYIDLIIDGGNLPKRKPSTVIDFTSDNLDILREGDLKPEGKDGEVFMSKNPEQTQALAEKLITSYMNEERPLLFILKGDLGTGKTVFTKAVAAELGVDDVISPTFVIYYEYDIPAGTFKRLYHFDLYNIKEEEEFEHLGLEELMKPGNLIIMEWGEKLGKKFESLKEKAKVILIQLEHISPEERKITITSL